VAITGDTGDCDSLPDLVGDADLAVIEATYAGETGISADALRRVHLTESRAVELGRMAKEHMLIHQVRSVTKTDGR
jgi:ribonuclease BN (tRNA processing enzyme)